MEEAKNLLDDKMQYCMDTGITDWGKIKTEIKDSLGTLSGRRQSAVR